MVHTIRFHRGKLPHWTVADHAYFVTICQKGCVPAGVMAESAAAPGYEERRFIAADDVLDRCPKSFRVLHLRPIAERLVAALAWLGGSDRGWILHAFCVMPTHIHLVMRNAIGRNGELERDLGCFKNYTGRLCNAELGRTGRFWAKEGFDHWCRSEDSVRRSVAYTLRNPVRAGLASTVSEWAWSGAGEEYAAFAEQL